MDANPTFQDLIEAARAGNWDLVDQHIKAHDNPENMSWALEVGLKDDDQDIRDLAATLLDVSEQKVDLTIIEQLEGQMQNDTYDIVRYRLAIALWKRGWKNQAVDTVMQKAMEDEGVGELAKTYYFHPFP